jgi:DNA-binding winged helix-turn-helix (wHTH) protein
VQQLSFGPYRFDLHNNRLWRGEQEVELQLRPLAVLRYLIERAGQVVTSEELLKQVWTGTYVSKTTLKVCVRALRVALGDTVTTPHYIETVGRQGYRFIAPLTAFAPPVAGSRLLVPGQLSDGSSHVPTPGPQQPATSNQQPF